MGKGLVGAVHWRGTGFRAEGPVVSFYFKVRRVTEGGARGERLLAPRERKDRGRV